MASYPEAKLTIKQILAAEWTTTPVAYQNGVDPVTTDENGNPIPWVYCEILNTTSGLRGCGTPGNHPWLYDGEINLHVFVPRGSGDNLAEDYAWQLGEIFRARSFYVNPPNFALAISPIVGGGDSASDDGLWWGVTCSIPWNYYHHG